jgi:hypothetical protein
MKKGPIKGAFLHFGSGGRIAFAASLLSYDTGIGRYDDIFQLMVL